MELIEGEFSIVLVGRWNPFIFNPEWIRTHLCEEQCEVVVAIPVDNPDAPKQISFSGIKLFPSANKLDVRPEITNVEELARCSEITNKVIQLLPHTPISAVGINFAFLEKNEPELVTNKVVFHDAASIDADEYQLQETLIRRTYEFNDNKKLNLLLSFDGGAGKINFNFHHDIENAPMGQSVLQGANIQNLYSKALEFTEKVYGLTLGEGDTK